MLLYSTMLDVNDTLTKEKFIQLVIKWNQESQYEENVIPGLVWDGQMNVRYGDDQHWLEIEEYRNGILSLSAIKKLRKMAGSGTAIM
ncbi:hypothetical protein [Lactobacillus delbrueckii]|uniref:hypothetical protein n=1 Tax=Lactobacillus delbrueckii TaxID=1584 RepID=UPI001E33D43E|nr:hypothetical protein [Lactobacillus delbrueckii]MCD5436576.1 hypothetical protein [Lactobacillus delbrueckii subsp. lactis]MCD5542827.1 hypothetical protein [Lactobacillus delbrueckii subsp. lactis]MCT3487376.1 hypothetical protein [Lactobacillus delbrueckii subsp. lactis]